MRLPPRVLSILQFAAIGIAMAAIFVADTGTSYEVAAAVFYAIVILIAARALGRSGLAALTAACIGLTVLSFWLTPHGDFHAGLINTGISIAAIVMTAYLVITMQAARTAAHLAQAQLMRMARVKSLEGLTTSIAHEVNQPLAAIVTSGHASQRWLAQEPPNLDKARQALARILDAADRASSIIVRVRSLTRGAPAHKSAFDLNQAILEVIALAQAEIDRNGIVLQTDLSLHLPHAHADRVQIQQVIGNLVLNAIEAMSAMPAHSRVLQISSAASDGTVTIAVADSGEGFPPEMHERLFEAFWTTKPHGIGVGLSISRAIVEANGGQIEAYPREGGGAVLRFTVPGLLQEAPQ
ncbi:sensor histidine kinase [Comamonas nitrativorans]|uniref:histidine kinase n=1 Tax=Comamonas nitrativorans TaxID=108437 RepID=A0ABV9GZJ9_9BURK